MKQVICPICKKTFTTEKPNKRFCSFSCKEAGARYRRMLWQDKNPDYMAAYMRDYRAKKKEPQEAI